ncbi:Lrp/AsnC family transcriptional regulator [Lutimaribacter sp. EGI FJ00015]|uniref:Lrp/AsnC family transcriptional regulator n=1 Tax=Lutimaribacter degradans TaxID=2945989 RepID=A0ACC6A0C7_9RHOB|nr:Lrp/AsnC family transcriptional regulator [Lutimaribacter sp. EGI FJ00013]MCM2563908.1 Lrp/AsnC family transcriptional regulator [Lutimaribacter sp. EGI FJ00013]MCO0615086.1 Lrp/AsnC family transcriptional regulator [Lutimaribacter sp. EGI FJ00015]MCO0637738.1 Lrp/AsnC family transcriptional regulator [Lutimaribacter sp. EGI FJ00014]
MTRLDPRDIAILQVLATDGRITKAALADRVGLSPTPCWERLRKLERAGLIAGYGARFNLRKLGPSVTIFVAAELEGHTAAHFRTFEQAVARHDEITACWSLGGGFDYLMQVVAPDIDAYQRLIDALLESRVGLARYYTYIVTKTVKESATPPFAALLGVAD